MARVGRRPGPTVTRAAVLAAARRQFARGGYATTTIRAVAREAGVDPGLVIQFYGSKDGLFDAAIALPFDPREILDELADAERSQLGACLLALFVRIWEDPATGPQMVALLRSATSNERAAERLRAVIDEQILTPLAARIGGPDGPVRAQLAGAQLVGLGLARYVLGLQPLAAMAPGELVAAVGPAVQRYLTDSWKEGMSCITTH